MQPVYKDFSLDLGAVLNIHIKPGVMRVFQDQFFSIKLGLSTLIGIDAIALQTPLPKESTPVNL